MLPQPPLGGKGFSLCITDCWAGGSNAGNPRTREGFANLLEDAADIYGSLFCFCPLLPPLLFPAVCYDLCYVSLSRDPVRSGP